MQHTTPTRRRILQATAGAAALVLTGNVVSPAEAKRKDAVRDANMAIGICFGGGGDPDSYENGNTIYVSCTNEDGSVTTLSYPYRR